MSMSAKVIDNHCATRLDQREQKSDYRPDIQRNCLNRVKGVYKLESEAPVATTSSVLTIAIR